MKLIDILVEELPKRDGWPAKASHAVYAKRLSRVCFTVGGAPAITGDDVSIFEDDGAGRGVFWLPGALLDCEEPIDYATAIITREQYEAALAAKNDGWIEWGGGECPVNPSEMVDVIFGHGGRMSTNIADCWRWNHSGTDSDIIAYRLHKPQEAEQAKVDDEADLNECIGQDAAPVWDGEGLPPVGCECEFISNDTSWGSVVVIGMDGDKVVIKPSGETYYGITPSEKQVFRPTRSEADKKRDEAVKTIMLTGWCQAAAEEIYDLVAAGKVPGMKLED